MKLWTKDLILLMEELFHQNVQCQKKFVNFKFISNLKCIEFRLLYTGLQQNLESWKNLSFHNLGKKSRNTLNFKQF